MSDTGTDPGRVRLADAADEDELMRAVRRMHSDNEWGLRDASGQPLPFCEERARSAIQRAIIPRRNQPGGLPAWVGILGEPGKLEASVYLSVELPWCSEAPFLAELWHWVMPEYRRTNNAKTLIAFSKAMATMLKIPLVMGVLTGERVMAKCRLYERQLGSPIGQFFLYNSDSPMGTA